MVLSGRGKDGVFFLFAAPVLITAVIPVGQVHFGDGVGQRRLQLLEFGDDVAIADTVIEPVIDVVTDGFGQAGDLAVARVLVPTEEGVDGGKVGVDGGAWRTPFPGFAC